MLNKELSHFAESGKAGNQVSEYIANTFLGELTFCYLIATLFHCFFTVHHTYNGFTTICVGLPE